MVARKKAAAKPRAKNTAKPEAPAPEQAPESIVEGEDAKPSLDTLIIDEGHRSLADYLPDEPPAGFERVENVLKGTTLSLADGSSIAFGKKADVPTAEAEFLRGRGQIA